MRVARLTAEESQALYAERLERARGIIDRAEGDFGLSSAEMVRQVTDGRLTQSSEVCDWLMALYEIDLLTPLLTP